MKIQIYLITTLLLLLLAFPGLAEQPLNPKLKFPDIESYQAAIGESGVILESEHVILYAPLSKTGPASIIFRYLVRAYDELYKIVGVHTNYKIVVYHFPVGSKLAFGGTSNCVIYYDYKNLNLDSHKEWKLARVPHVSGYIEEMAHNFVDATKAQFGWEMVGWSIGIQASQKVAGNTVLDKALRDTRAKQAGTFDRYKADGFIFPKDIPANLCDRIHAWLLYQCEQKYGPNFWPDFFTEVCKEKDSLKNAVSLGNGDKIRNERYRITVECFNRLPGINFKELLEKNDVSTDISIKSLHPTDPGWNRRMK
jgi:hypothetical protein